MNYIKLDFALPQPDDADILTALLEPLSYVGCEETAGHLLVYFDETTFNDDDLRNALSPHTYPYTKYVVPQQNWNADWESNFQPIRINDEVGVRADFHPPFEHCRYDLVITPKMSFGTGHHATTKMMLEYGCETDVQNKAVLDFGCGTGVLAILAARKGAGPVEGIDNDAWSVENARENCLRNACPNINISDRTLESFQQSFDIILANINLNVLLETLPRLRQMLNPGGSIFLSGILSSDMPAISACFGKLGMKLLSQKQEKEWVALHITV